MTALSVPVLACVSRAGKFPGLHATEQYFDDSLERAGTGTP